MTSIKGRTGTNCGHCATTKPHRIPADWQWHIYLQILDPKKQKTTPRQAHFNTTPGFPCSPSHHFFRTEKRKLTMSHKPTPNVYPNDSAGGDPSAAQCFKSQSMRGNLMDDVIPLPDTWSMRATRQLMDVNVRVDEMQSWWPFPPEPILVSGIKNTSASLQLVSVTVWLLVSWEIDGCEGLLLQMLLHLWVLSGKGRGRMEGHICCVFMWYLFIVQVRVSEPITVVQSRKCWSITEPNPRLQSHWCLLIHRENRGGRQQGKPGGREEARAPGAQHAANTWMSYTGLEEGMAANCR